ncbi:MAG: hypothetical protein JWM93_3601 [Frankiales bacterium]|nr:hypothetical protein [Frankiales bacterium]
MKWPINGDVIRQLMEDDMRVRGSKLRVPVAGLLPGLFVGGLIIATPMTSTSSALAAGKQPVKQAIVIDQAVLVDPAATTFLVELYLSIVAIAAVIVLYALLWARTAERRVARRENRRLARASAVWTDALTATTRTGRSPAPAPLGALRRSLRAASAPPA